MKKRKATMLIMMMTLSTIDDDEDDDDDDDKRSTDKQKKSGDKKPLFSCSRRTKGISDKRPRCPEVRLGIRKPTSAHQEVRSLNDRDVQK